MKRNLIIVCAGRSSKHRTWLTEDPNRNWDLYVCPFVEIPPTTGNGVTTGSSFYTGFQFAALSALLDTWRGWESYRYIVLADDDLIVPPGTWSKFFARVVCYHAALSAPALTPDSIASHRVTVQRPGARARRVSFVEGMMPCFRVDVLEKLRHTFAETKTGIGYGLDYVWPKLLDYKGIYIIDETPITHPRGHTSRPEIDAAALREMAAMLKKYDCECPPEGDFEVFR
jgi:hypothetical protein